MVIITTFSPPEEGLLHHEPSCQLLVDNADIGSGDLYVTENAVVWAGPQGARVSLAYRQISLHAVQRVPSPLIYMMLDYKLTVPELQTGGGNMEADEEYDPDEMPSTEIKLVPQSETSLTAIYEALNTGQSLHPDPDDSDSGDEDFMAADDSEVQQDDAATRMEGLTIEQANGNGVADDDEDDEDEQFADA